MRTKSVKTLVKQLRRYNARYERLRKRRDRTPHGPLGLPPNAAHEKLNKEANTLCGKIMHTERCIINALMREEP